MLLNFFKWNKYFSDFLLYYNNNKKRNISKIKCQCCFKEYKQEEEEEEKEIKIHIQEINYFVYK